MEMSKVLTILIFAEAIIGILNLLLYIESRNMANGVAFAVCVLASLFLIVQRMDK